MEDQQFVCEDIRGRLEAAGSAIPLQQQASEVRAVLLNRRLPGE